MKIRLILTGGTIDKKYNELTGELGYADTHVNKMLEQGRSRASLVIEKPMLLDSLDMTEVQRQEVLRLCQISPEDHIVLTHGTDTMAQTAQLLGQNIQDKTIVLTGAMIPYAFGNSDGLFNLGAAITSVQLLDKGVYIAMNGRIFTYDNVVKNKALGEFQER